MNDLSIFITKEQASEAILKNANQENCAFFTLNALLKAGGDVEYEDFEDFMFMTPLQICAKHGNQKAISKLIEAGADMNRCSPFCRSTSMYDNKLHLEVRLACYTPLMLAALYGHLEVAQKLIHAGAAPNENNADIYDSSALIFAAQFGHEEVCSTHVRKVDGIAVHLFIFCLACPTGRLCTAWCRGE